MTDAHEQDPDVVVTHPNRDSAAAKGTRATVMLVQLASAVLLFVITIGSMGAQAGALPLQIAIGLLFLYFAYAVANWRSGILPVAAGTAVVSGIFAAVTVSGWFGRGGQGYDDPPLPESVIGVLVFAFAVLQLVNTVVCLKGFQQQWQVELEVPRHEARGGSAGRPAVA